MGMERLLKQVIFLLAALFWGVTSGLACSLASMPPTNFDRSQYLFTGEVTGYVESVNLMKSKPEEWDTAIHGKLSISTSGLVVTVNDTFYTPEPAKKVYEIFRFGLGAGCEIYGFSLDELKQRYKIGQQVRVAAGKATHVAPSSHPNINRLELRFSSEDLIDAVVDFSGHYDISSLFDYKAYRTTLAGAPFFEMLKDLRRLDLASDQGERNKILDRLTYFPRSCVNCTFVLGEVYRKYASNETEFKRYAELVRQRDMTADEFKRLEERRLSKP